ncbi:unnamed protein product [Rotaria sp. Silwood2]|nr:unnamed protein product [Rotaria sp. Silwood2]CAF2570732.1 unnamed protein product [Rotaria sp. Silwood2]CAF3531956.1 unnamed protein product [Rotaria sp. Silwood2]CAF4064566.1 unnamed protein product [Rotaria sp. Silwood2]CAF4272323.1 unnamed protein product [Rotaria sp. Silwood2]
MDDTARRRCKVKAGRLGYLSPSCATLAKFLGLSSRQLMQALKYFLIAYYSLLVLLELVLSYSQHQSLSIQ